MTEPEDRLVGNGQAAEANFPTPPTRAAVPDWYPELLDAVADCVRTGRQRAVSAANQELVSTYWAMGAEILARQDAEGWGTRVIDRLSADLRERFPAHLRILATQPQVHAGFAAAWPDFAIVQRSVAQLPWRHNVALLDKLDTADMRLWYASRNRGMEPRRPRPSHRRTVPRARWPRDHELRPSPTATRLGPGTEIDPRSLPV
jgi:predicted nuclease of restriction endonuclease-like (RecB) superfamily